MTTKTLLAVPAALRTAESARGFKSLRATPKRHVMEVPNFVDQLTQNQQETRAVA
jgi:hypothetical protein